MWSDEIATMFQCASDEQKAEAVMLYYLEATESYKAGNSNSARMRLADIRRLSHIISNRVVADKAFRIGTTSIHQLVPAKPAVVSQIFVGNDDVIRQMVLARILGYR